jgi:hypothetical protein
MTLQRLDEGDYSELFARARVYLSSAFPNPDRLGCPPDTALAALARNPTIAPLAIGDHISCCSPCFCAYMSFLADAKAETARRRKARRVVWIRSSAAAFAVTITLVFAIHVFITKARTKPLAAPPAAESTPGTPNPIQNQTTIYFPVVIDLGNASPTRGPGQDNRNPVPPVIPARSRLALSLRLPLGSEERLYSIALRSRQDIVWSESALARRENGDTLLRVPADFSHLPAGRYTLQVSSAGRRLTIPILIQGGLPENKPPRP